MVTQSTPGPTDAVVRGEDTFLILHACPSSGYDMTMSRPVQIGTLLCTEGEPLKISAVVYDFDADPICTAACIEKALRDCFALAKKRNLKSLTVPLLGAEHGHLPAGEVAEIYARVLQSRRNDALECIWLLLDDRCKDDVAAALTGAVPRPRRKSVEHDLL